MNTLEELSSDIIAGKAISPEDARSLSQANFNSLLKSATRIRRHFKGNEVKLCGIVNAKSGNCSEDCKFCSQSIHSNSKVETYPLLGFAEISESHARARKNKASCFGIITSGRSLKGTEIDAVCVSAGKLKDSRPAISVSLGELDEPALRKLKKAGVKRIHHNIETSESFFPSICTTHTFKDKATFISRAKREGFEICSGVLFGLGETFDQRVEAVYSLRKLNVSSVPMNFFNPIAGTALERTPRLSTEEILRTIAMFRFVLPDKDIRVCGGRETNLRDQQDRIFEAGANGMMVGGYLTTGGRQVEEDLKMIEGLGLKIYE